VYTQISHLQKKPQVVHRWELHLYTKEPSPTDSLYMLYIHIVFSHLQKKPQVVHRGKRVGVALSQRYLYLNTQEPQTSDIL